MIRGGVLGALLVSAEAAMACAPSHPIVLDAPASGEDIGAGATEVTLRWHIDSTRVPEWKVDVWNATDGEALFEGTSVKTNVLRVTGLKPHKTYYWKVARNWTRFEEGTFATGERIAPAAKALPARFGDKSRYDLVEMPEGKSYDLGLTRFRGWTRVKVDRASKTEFSVCVPCEEYCRAWVLVKVDPDPRKDRAFTVRLTRHVNGPWRKYLGRSFESMANAHVELERTPGEDLGDGFRLVEVPLPTADIQDIVFTDQRGDFIRERGRYLDLELMGRLSTQSATRDDRRCDTDPDLTSAVTVYGVALEKPGAEMEIKTVEPGNIFANDEKPEGIAEIRVRRPGRYALRRTVTDSFGRVVSVTADDVSAGGSFRVPFAHTGEDWYSLTWELFEGERPLLTHHASFAVLGEDTRTTEAGEQYGTWPSIHRSGSHYRSTFDDTNAVETALEILHKAGFRRVCGVNGGGRVAGVPSDILRKWKMGLSYLARFPQDWEYVRKGGETNLVAELNRRLRENPNCKVVNFYHEHAPVGGPAPEALGLKPGPKHLKDRQKMADNANMWGAFMRKHFPDAQILVGNHHVCGEFIAELLRHGFKPEYADAMGLEVMGSETLPEHQQHNDSIEAAELLRLMAKRFGCDRWTVDQCYESNFRHDRVVGAEKQASYYVRDVLLAYVWGMKNIYVGTESDAANHYAMSAWGADGLCVRSAYYYPKRAYAAMATVTKLLDRVTGVRKIPTGDECVYAVEFTRKDGKAVTAFWTSRGEAEVKVEGVGVGVGGEQVDMYGRSAAFRGKVVASDRVQYVVGAPGSVKGVSVVKRTFPEDAKPADYTVVATTDRAADWMTAAAPLKDVENDFVQRNWPHRSFTPAKMRAVMDEEMGPCVELELVDDGKSVAAPHFRYNALLLRKPVRVGRDFRSLGCTVKGNSGWGEIYYILEDAKGRRTVSCSTRAQGKRDSEGRTALSFTGWNFIRYALKPGSSVKDLAFARPLWSWTDEAVATCGDLSLVGIVFAARFQPLYLDEAKPCRQVIRIKDVGVFD